MLCKKINFSMLVAIIGTLAQGNVYGQGPWTEQGTASGVSYNLSHLVYIEKKDDPPVMASTFNPGETVISDQTVEVHNTTNAIRKVELEMRLRVWDSQNGNWQHFTTLSESRTLMPGETATLDFANDYVAPQMPNTPERIEYKVRLVIQNNFVTSNLKEVTRHH